VRQRISAGWKFHGQGRTWKEQFITRETNIDRGRTEEPLADHEKVISKVERQEFPDTEKSGEREGFLLLLTRG